MSNSTHSNNPQQAFPTLAQTMPTDAAQAVLIGRLWVPGLGPHLVRGAALTLAPQRTWTP